MTIAGKINLVLSAVGAAVFAALFIYVSFAPDDFDRRVADFAVVRVQEKVAGDLRSLTHSKTMATASRLAGIFSSKLQRKIDKVRGEEVSVAFITDMLAASCKLNCERRAKAAQAVHSFYEHTLARYGLALDRLRDIIKEHYQQVVNRLHIEFQIFSGTTFLTFAFAFALSIFRGRAARYLLPVSFSLTVATVLACIWYIFGQNWIMAIVLSDYWGWSYAGITAVLWLLMLDIAINRARVINVIFGVFGAAAHMPC